MKISEKAFITEVSARYSPYQSKVDDKFNIVVNVDGRDVTITPLLFLKIFNVYSRTNMSREEALNMSFEIIDGCVKPYAK